jgi:hypothetical protein
MLLIVLFVFMAHAWLSSIKTKVMLARIKTESRIAIVMFFAAIMSFSAVRAHANLTVQTYEMGHFSLELNGQFYDFNQNMFSMPNIMPGMYNVRLHRWMPSFGNQGTWNIVYQGVVQVLAMHNTVLNYNSWTGATVQHHPVVGGPNMPHPPNPGMPIGGFFMGMDPMAFDQFMVQLNNISFDSNKLDFAKFAIRQNGITVAQLRQVLARFSFDSNRLNVAQFAYQFTIDRHNYFMLQDAFAFQSNFRRLMEGI